MAVNLSQPNINRREFLITAAALPLQGAPPAREEIVSGLRVITGSVNTAVLERNGKQILIDSGEITSSPRGGIAEWALFTHHHRDQASGASGLAASGTKLAVPATERHFFENAFGFWDSADNILNHRYDFRPHVFTLRESVPVARGLKGGDAHSWEGLKIEVIDTPGHTDGSVTYLVEIGGKRVALTGDLICGPGQLWEMYSLQKRFPGMRGDYWGFGGGVSEVKASLDRVMESKPDLLVPSHGPIITDPPAAVAMLKKNLDAVMNTFLVTAGWRISPNFKGIYPRDKEPRMLPALPRVSYPKWIRDVAATTKVIVADDRSVFVSDCGNQRAIDELANLQAAGAIGAVEGLWISHYHDDHTQSVNVAKRRFGAKVYVQREMVDIIENPFAYQMPCLFPESIRVDRVVEDGETIDWKGFKLTFYYFPGQTVYHAALLVERDNYKVLFTGDSFTNWGVDDYCSQNRNFIGPGVGYEKCFDLLLKIKPDMLVAAHWGPEPVSQEHVRKTRALFQERQRLLRNLFPHDDVNFGLDPCWIRAYPYRQQALPATRVTIEARIMNHSADSKTVKASLVLPKGWTQERATGTTEIPARTEGCVRLHAIAPATPVRRRQVIGLSAEVNGRPLGEFAEAIVDFLVRL